MGIVSSLYTGSSGIQAMGNAMQVIGNNIANVNTVGFKASRAEFSDLLSSSLSGGSSSQIGRGVEFKSVTGIFSQGSFQNTASGTDLAISGGGYFVLSNGQSNVFSRAGQFSIDETGRLVNLDGLAVQGYQYDDQGNNVGVLSDIALASLSAPPEDTNEVTVAANLDAEGPLNAIFDSTSTTTAVETSNFSTSLTVYDSLGSSHVVNVYFNKTSDNNWEWHALTDGSEVVGGTAGTPVEFAEGTLAFNTDGSLNTVLETTTAPGIDFNGGAEAGQIISFNFGDQTNAPVNGSGLDGVTQFAGPQVTVFQRQDGFSQGSLQGIDIDSSGVITGIFSNGRSTPVAQLALANFQSQQGLTRIGNNLFQSSVASGLPTIGEPNTGRLGTIASNSLELSNVDLTTEFIQMITNQRGFQANSRVVSVGDELLEQVVNLT